MIAGGLLLLIFAGDFSGAWFIVLGWFLFAAAEAEIEGANARIALGGLTAADAMVPYPVTVDADATVEDFMDEIFLATRHTAFPVFDRGGVAGIVSFRQALELPRAIWAAVPVREIMVPADEVCVDAQTPLPQVLARLIAAPLQRLLICRGGQLVGLLSLNDVARLIEARSRSDWHAREGQADRARALPGGSAHRRAEPFNSRRSILGTPLARSTHAKPTSSRRDGQAVAGARDREQRPPTAWAVPITPSVIPARSTRPG